MPVIYITGVGGSGKSTIRLALQANGYKALDADYDGFMGWRNKKTGIPVFGPDIPGYLTPKWYEEYEWRISRAAVEALAAQARDELVFLCGTSANDEDVHDLLSAVVYLTIDGETVMERLVNRETNAWGKQPADIAHVMKWLKPAEDYYRNFGAFMLDATRPVEEIVDQVVEYATSICQMFDPLQPVEA